ncbi:MAG TPA: hypothetical protein VH951_07150, partial [Dehalococcoidia bacterium]
ALADADAMHPWGLRLSANCNRHEDPGLRPAGAVERREPFGGSLHPNGTDRSGAFLTKVVNKVK